jgi:hypothetical protein
MRAFELSMLPNMWDSVKENLPVRDGAEVEEEANEVVAPYGHWARGLQLCVTTSAFPH